MVRFELAWLWQRAVCLERRGEGTVGGPISERAARGERGPGVLRRRHPLRRPREAEVVVLDNLWNNRGRRWLQAAAVLRELNGGGFTVHFAGLNLLHALYYENNIAGTVNLLKAMGAEPPCKNIVFSSSATVYGDPASVPVTESFPTSATNPYGRTKLFIEEILRDVHKLRRVVERDPAAVLQPGRRAQVGRIGEDPKGIPNNLMPYIQQVAVGKREHLSVFGEDYPTADGTGMRDYIHVVDLAKGHLAALKRLGSNPGCVTYNLGTGVGYSVLDVLNAYSKACGKELAHKMAERRPGDVAVVYGDPALAKAELGWAAMLTLEDMCADSWNWISKNPDGFQAPA